MVTAAATAADAQSDATACSADDANRRRGEHGEQVAGQPVARMPILESDDVAVGGVEFAQAKLHLFRDDHLGVIVRETQPGDVGPRVVMAVDLHKAYASPVSRA